MESDAQSRKSRKKRIILVLLFATIGLVLVPAIYERLRPQEEMPSVTPTTFPPFDPGFLTMTPYEMAATPRAVRFDQPLGTVEGALAYNAQPFGRNRHLGADLNGIGGWNSDLGDPVYAAGRGRVILARDAQGGWGNIVMVAHRISGRAGAPAGDEIIQTVYAHLDSIKAIPGETVERGQLIGTVGNANGAYLAHLHFEIRTSGSLDPGAGYDLKVLDRLNPTQFLAEFGNPAPQARFPAPGITATDSEPQLRFAPVESDNE